MTSAIMLNGESVAFNRGRQTLTQYDSLSQRCPMLGHEVQFSYCRKPGDDSPCRKIVDCWRESFDIQGYVAKNYSTEIQKRLSEPPKPKILSLIEIIEQAKERIKTVQGDSK